MIVVLLDAMRVWAKALRGTAMTTTELPYVPSKLSADDRLLSKRERATVSS